MLPEGFKWQSIYGPSGAGDTNAFAYRMHQVARLDEKIGGSWIAVVLFVLGVTIYKKVT